MIYCNSSLLREFLSAFSFGLHGATVIAGGSDEIFIDEVLRLGSVSRLYLQNSHVSDGHRVITLPIGLEDLSLALNGFPSYLRHRNKSVQRRVLVGPFSSTHSVRSQIVNSIKSTEEVVIMKGLLTPGQYSRLVRRFPAVACPRGNGEDTHRLWETLYRGSIPIVAKNNWSMSLSAMGVPLIALDDWSADSLHFALSQIPLEAPNPKKIPLLWADWWSMELDR